MLIRDISVKEVKDGRIWRVADDSGLEMVDWAVEPVSSAGDEETVVYSALVVFRTGKVMPQLLIREVGTYEWWGDSLVNVDGAWRPVHWVKDAANWDGAESYVAAPLPNDPSFVGGYSHEEQRAGFARWSARMHD